MRRRLRLVLACATLALVSCVTSGGSIQLASIHQLETTEILAGEEFKIFGDGFVPGEVEVVLDGSWLTPGHEPRQARLSFGGNAITEKEISTVLPLETFHALAAPHALFVGEVRARFAASDRVKPDYIEAVRGRVALDVLSNEPDGGRDLSRLESETERFLDLMGLAGQSSPEGGFLLTGIDGHGPADEAGLETGDLVVVSRGMRVYSELDLLPPPMSTKLDLVVARADDAGVERLRKVTAEIPRKATAHRTNPLWFVAAAVAGSLVLLQGEVLALLLVPLRRLREMLAAIVRRLGRTRRRVVSVDDDQDASRVPGSRWIQNMLSLPVVIAAASGCAALMLTLADSIHVAVVYLTLVGLTWLTGFRASRSAGARIVGQLRRLLVCLVVPVPVAFMFIWRGLYTLRPSLDAAASGQGLEPWTWHGLHDPFALVLILLGLQAAVLFERRDIPLARHLAHQVYSVATCAVIAYVMLGGLGPAPGAGDPGSSQAVSLGLLMYVAKVLALHLVVQAYARDRMGRRTSDVVILLARPALLTAAMVGSVMLGPSMEATLPVLPYITAAAGAAVGLVMAASGRTGSGTAAIRIRPW